MERIINYTVDLNEIHPKAPVYAGVQGEHNATAIKFSFSEEFDKQLQDLPHFYVYIQFRIDYTDSLGNIIYGEVKDISEITEPFYLTRVMTKQGGNATAVLKITCINYEGAEKEFYTGVMRFYFDSCPSVLLSDDDQGSILSPIVNQARIYRNEAYDCAKVAVEAEDDVKKILQVVDKFPDIEEKLDSASSILTDCQEATSLAQDAANGVVTIEQNRKIPLKISVMTKDEYAATTRPDPDGVATLDLIEDELSVDYIYPVGSIYMSVNDTDPAILFGGSWERIKDKFLLSCGDTYPAGSMGGEEAHTLTTDEMPIHTHGMLYQNQDAVSNNVGRFVSSAIGYGADAKEAFTGTNYITETGGNVPHNNMPPYLAVYMWLRRE